ncbi:hypothetical protein D3C83_222900 [compost metagenome]
MSSGMCSISVLRRPMKATYSIVAGRQTRKISAIAAVFEIATMRRGRRGSFL